MIVRPPQWPSDQAVTWDPGRVPAFQRPTAYDAFIAADLPSRCHRFSAAVNRATLAGSMTRFRHGPVCAGSGLACNQTKGEGFTQSNPGKVLLHAEFPLEWTSRRSGGTLNHWTG